MTYQAGARDARQLARQYGMTAAVQVATCMERMNASTEYVRGMTDTLLVLVQVGGIYNG